MAFTVSSCDDGFGDLNVNPTQSPDLEPAFQLTYNLTWLSTNRYEHWRTNFILTSCFIQHTAQTAGYFEGDKYTYGIPSYNAALWDAAYTREIKNLVDLIDRTKDDPSNANVYNAARITFVYAMSRMTDLYGDVPYFQAGRGAIDREFFPAYDEQSAIYADMLSTLASAVSGFDDGATVPGDIFFGGDVAKWKKWGNSLRLRLGMRLSKVDAGTAQSEVSGAISGGVMESNDDIAMMTHNDQYSNGNSDVFAADKGMRLSKTFTDMMISMGDPRLPIFGAIYMDQATLDTYSIPNAVAAPNDNSPVSFMVVDATSGDNILANFMTDPTGLDGLPNGTFGADLGDKEKDRFIAPNYENLLPRNVPYLHQTYAEVEFLLAEAAVRDWGGSDAKTHYENGLRAMVEQMSLFPGSSASIVAAANIDEFVTNNSNGFEALSKDDQLKKIGEALWSSLYLDGYEAFAHWRRTGYPELVPVNADGNVTGGTIPRRCHYPQSEAGNNKDNYLSAIGRMSDGDSYTSRVWWDTP